MKSIKSFIYTPLVILVSFIFASIFLDYLLYFAGVNVPFLRYPLHIVAILVSFIIANSGSKILSEEALNIKKGKTGIEQFELVTRELNDERKRETESFKKFNYSLENLANTGAYTGDDDRIKKISDKILQLEAHFTGIRRSGLSKWEHISKNIVELKEDLAKKEKKLKDLHEFSENLIAVNFEAKLENDSYVNNNLNKLASQINLMISEKDNILKKLEEKELEIKDLNNKLREAKSKEPKVTISSGALKITAPKRAANVDAKDFIDFTGRGFGKY